MDDDWLEAILEDLEIAAIVRERTAAGPAVPMTALLAEFGVQIE
ncbi:hypothetical protein [Salinibacterium sp. ZJ450]|nr:hypothetical protein [Salinibacterium sp. ZJ450]